VINGLSDFPKPLKRLDGMTGIALTGYQTVSTRKQTGTPHVDYLRHQAVTEMNADSGGANKDQQQLQLRVTVR
jgi:hypothetical protein